MQCRADVASSLLPVPHTMIIAGARFREMYYWDAYWILKGLLACHMQSTAVGLVKNLVYLIDTLGFVPNGNRVRWYACQPASETHAKQCQFMHIIL